jgi:hypothetical protein
METFSLDNMIREPTFTSSHGSSLIDVALTNNTNYFQDSAVIDVGSSDGHSLICVVSKLHLQKQPAKCIAYRSYKHFNQDKYREDIQNIPFSVCDCFDDPEDTLWAQNKLITEVLDQHAPLKARKIRPGQPAFMNKTLRKSIMKKTMLRNRFIRNKRPCDWERYRIQRNITTKLRRKSIKQYFEERCNGGPRNEHFYKTIKPFLSSRFKNDSNLMIHDGQSLLTNPKEVAESMNEFFINIASNIGNDVNIPNRLDFDSNKDFLDASLAYHANHPSITSIRTNGKADTEFKFRHAKETTVSKIIKNLNTKKATGSDTIPAKALACVHDILAPPFTRLYNKCIETSSFPESAKNV